MHPVDARIAAIAARQAGVIGCTQLLSVLLSRGAIRKRLANGSLHPVFPGAYSVGVPATRIGAVGVAALISTGPSFISHRDAVEEYGLIAPIPGPVHVTVAHGRRLRREGIVVHRTRHLPPVDRVRRGPLRLTSPARTLVDIAGTATERQLTRAYDEGCRLGLVTAAAVEAACMRANGRPGTRVLLALAREARLPCERTRSPGEARFLRFCADHHLPIPLVNVALLGYEVDFLWPGAKLFVEFDSSYHDDPRARAADTEREGRLRAAGFRELRVRDGALRAAPGGLAARLRGATGERDHG
jgi:hypothetical protein